ncbi:MAG: hypothetical protein IJO94_06700, partial [Firmicutes bacterium]|nr:hypothetical protein [Bacillota bacterium]
MKRSLLILVCVLFCLFALAAGASALAVNYDELSGNNAVNSEEKTPLYYDVADVSQWVMPFSDTSTDSGDAGDNAVSVKLAFYNCETNSFVVMPMDLTVEPKTAEKYGVDYTATSSGFDTGFTVGDTDVTVVDAICAAHEQYYDDFSKDNFGEYIICDEFFSYVTKLFGVQTQNGISFYVNGKIPMAYNSEQNYWFGYPINQCILEDGDFIYFFGYESMSLSEWVSSFDQTSVEVKANEEFTLTLQGHAAMAWEDVQVSPLAGVEIYALNADGSIGDSFGKTTDAEGKVTLSFDTAGTYYVTAQGSVTDEYGMTGAIAAPFCCVTVKEDVPANNAPAVKEGAAATASVDLGNAFTLDLSTVFEDADGDALTYTAKVGDAEAAATD